MDILVMSDSLALEKGEKNAQEKWKEALLL